MSLSSDLRDLRLRVHALEEQAEQRTEFDAIDAEEDEQGEDYYRERLAQATEDEEKARLAQARAERELAECRAELAAQQRNHLSVVAALVAQVDGWKAKAESRVEQEADYGDLEEDEEGDYE